MVLKLKKVKKEVWIIVAGVVLLVLGNPQIMSGLLLSFSIGLALIIIGIGMLVFRRY